MATNASFFTRAGEMLAAFLIALAMAGMQVFIGGTRLAYDLPLYALLGLGGLCTVFSLRETKPSAGRICLFSAALFFGYVLVRAWYSPVPYLARADIFSVLGGLTVYLAVALIFTSARWRLSILLGLLVVALVQVGIGAIQFRNGNNFMLIRFLQRFDYGRRASGFYVCPNHFAGLVEIIGLFCVSLACWSRWPVWAKLLIAYAGAICYAGLALTGSRGGYLSAAVSLLVVGILSLIALRRTGSTIFWRTAGVSGLFALLLVAAVIFGFRQSDFLRIRAQNVVDPQNVRLDLWRAALAQWRLQPAVGTGSGTYLYYGRRFRSERVQLDPVEVHNDYLQLLAEYGAVGGAAFLFFLGAHLWRGVDAFGKLGPRRIAISARPLSNNLALTIGALGAVAAYAVHSFFDFNLHIPANVLLLAFVFAILATPDLSRAEDRLVPPVAFARLVLPLLGVLLLAGSLRYSRTEYDAERARVALRDERHLAAARWAQKAIALDDQNPEAFFYLGESRVRRAEDLAHPTAVAAFYRAAIDPLQRASALAPNDETFLIALGRVYDALGRFREAEWMFGRAQDWDPRSIAVQKSYQAHLASWSEARPGPRPLPRSDLPDKNEPLPEPTATPSPGIF
jgi:O-antigen ligase